MGVIADLIKEIPAAGKYESGLDAIEKENASLKAENAELKQELAHYIQRWETLDGDGLKTLIYISRYERGHAAEIAQACQMNVQIVETYMRKLLQDDYILTPLNGAEHSYGLAYKGRRYLSERGLLQQAG